MLGVLAGVYTKMWDTYRHLTGFVSTFTLKDTIGISLRSDIIAVLLNLKYTIKSSIEIRDLYAVCK